MEANNTAFEASGKAARVMLGLGVLFALYLASLHSYPLFHSLAEVFSIVVASGVFMISWNTRRTLENNYLLLIGIAYVFVAGLDFVHVLAYEGMGVFLGYGTNLPTQLWIAARFMESLALFVAPFSFNRALRPGWAFFGSAAVFSFLIISIFYLRIFPDCFVDGVGLTPFKKTSEYVISCILMVAGVLLYRNRGELDASVLRWVLWSILLTIGSELSFTFYVSAYGLSNLIGHYLKILSFYCIYKAIIETGLSKPYNLLLRNLKQNEEALRKSEESVRLSEDRLRVTLRSIGDAVIATDAEGRITFMNPVAAGLTGWTEAEARGRMIEEVFRVVDERTREPAVGVVKTVLHGGGVVFLANDTSLLSRDGREIPIEDSAAPIVAGEGKTSGLVVVFHDVTEKRRNMLELHRSETRARLLAGIAGRLLVSAKPQRLINELCLDVMEYLDCSVFFSFLAQDSIGKLRLHAFAGISADEAGKIQSMDYADGVCGRAAAEGTSTVIEDVSRSPDPRTGLLKDFGIQAYACFPLMVDGKTIGTLSFGAKNRLHFSSQDIALMQAVGDQVATAMDKERLIVELQESRDNLERRVQERTAELLKASEALRDQASLLNMARDAIFVRDMTEVISFWNTGAEDIYGFTSAEAVGRKSHELLKTKFPEPLERIKEKVVRDGEWSGELRHTKAGGEEIFVESKWGVHTGRAGEPIGFLEINRDVTARKKAEEELMTYMTRLEVLNKELADFAFIASHDLQEPLRKIQTFGHMLTSKFQDALGPQGRDYLGRMIRSAGRMSDLLRSLLCYSRVGTGDLDYQPTDLVKIVIEVVSDLEVLIQRSNARVEIGPLPFLEADPSQMRQLFQNLIENSIKYCNEHEPPVVRISGTVSGETCRLCIIDNGIGFGQEFAGKIFEPFERLHGRNDKYGGTGMGLAICRKIVVRHCGDISVYSEEGKGTTFTVTLPRNQAGCKPGHWEQGAQRQLRSKW
ncbi:MAG: PAS domain S-box protein [Desulfobacteraceae bacterium]|nr:PAS domain S-box protein [Desulfobacteraceae bacterium]